MLIANIAPASIPADLLVLDMFASLEPPPFKLCRGSLGILFMDLGCQSLDKMIFI